MAQLTEAKNRSFAHGDVNDIAIAADTVIFRGSAVSEAAATGLANQLVATETFLGFALETVDNTGGAAGAKQVPIQHQGLIELPIATVAQTDLGGTVYASDGDTFTMTSTSNSAIGTLHRVITVGTPGLAIVKFNAP